MTAPSYSVDFAPGTVLEATTPAGYRRFAGAAVVGAGHEDLRRLGAAVLDWRMQRASGIRVLAAGDDTDAGPAEEDIEVRLSIRIATLAGAEVRTLAPARVVRVLDEPTRIGFVYGTLPGHPERGEEAFLVESRPDGAVLARIIALSRPAMPYALAAPVLLRLQRRYTARYLRALLPA